MNLIDKINYWAKLNPNKMMFSFINENIEMESSYTYLEFKQVTDTLARYLLQNFSSKDPNEKVNIMLVYPTGMHFLISFIACLKAKMIPISVYPPHPHYLKKDLIQFSNIVKNCNVKIALTDTKYYNASLMGTIKSFFGCTWPKLQWIKTDQLSLTTQMYNSVTLPKINPEDMAFIQYTSGTITDPKPIKVRHKNLIRNLETIIHSLSQQVSLACIINVSWLPQYHDMGLIGSRLCPIYNGGSSIFMSPFTFIKNPTQFLEICSNYKATNIQGPHFMYKFLARKWKALKDPPQLDLSSLHHIFNGAEPINVDEYQYFYETFQEYGLKKEALAVGYGLAESVIYVCDTGSNNQRTQGHLVIDEEEFKNNRICIINEGGKKIASCGKPPEGSNIDIKIYFEGEIKKELDIGEIIISSDSIVEEYKNLKIDDRKYVMSGDLGFLYRGELFVTGRSKDMIIINGKNYYPQDFEWIIDRNENIRGGSTAAFEDNNQIIAITEVKNTVDKKEYSLLVKSLQKDIGTIFGMRIIIYLVPRGSVIKTTSGKVSRGKCRQQYHHMKILNINL